MWPWAGWGNQAPLSLGLLLQPVVDRWLPQEIVPFTPSAHRPGVAKRPTLSHQHLSHSPVSPGGMLQGMHPALPSLQLGLGPHPRDPFCHLKTRRMVGGGQGEGDPAVGPASTGVGSRCGKPLLGR